MINGKYKKKIKEKIDFMWQTSEMVKSWCQSKKQEEESSQNTLKILTKQLTTINNENESDNESDNNTPNKNDTLKMFRNSFKNLVNKDGKGKGKDDFDTKIQALRNLILKKKQEAFN